jgi:hypothetical protein
MSQTIVVSVDFQTDLTEIEHVKTACNSLGWEFTQKKHHYEIGVTNWGRFKLNTDGKKATVTYDTENILETDIEKLLQAYQVSRVKSAAAKNGFGVTQTQDLTGKVLLTLTTY